jgi:muconolactone delta-isomerase
LIVNFLEKKFLKYANTHLLKLRNANGEFLDLSILKEKENLTNQLSSLSHEDFTYYLNNHFEKYSWLDLFSQKNLVNSQLNAYRNFLDKELDEEEIFFLTKYLVELAYYYKNTDINFLKNSYTYDLDKETNNSFDYYRSKNIYKILEIADKKTAGYLKNKVQEIYDQSIRDEEFINRDDIPLSELYKEASRSFVKDGIIDKFWENVKIYNYSSYSLEEINELGKILDEMKIFDEYINISTINSHFENMLKDKAVSKKIKNKIILLSENHDILNIKKIYR